MRSSALRGLAAGLLGLLLALSARGDAPSPAALEVGKFSAARPGGPLPEGWTPLLFAKIERHTAYDLVEEGGKAVVRARAEASASGLTRKVAVDLRQQPFLEWSWKVEGLIAGADLGKKAADDAPARVYVTFAYDPAKAGLLERARFGTARLLSGEYPPAAAINYVWASKEAAGTVLESPYTSRSRIVVVRGGPEGLGEWHRERRNVLEDYRKAFGEEPPPVSGVALMTDSDNTSSTATAHYGDLTFKN